VERLAGQIRALQHLHANSFLSIKQAGHAKVSNPLFHLLGFLIWRKESINSSLIVLQGLDRQGIVPWQPSGVKKQTVSSGGLGSSTSLEVGRPEPEAIEELTDEEHVIFILWKATAYFNGSSL
jgi:hypothetical protein